MPDAKHPNAHQTTHSSPASPRWPLLLSLGLISGAALSYEILLMRLLSIIQWHHFAYMIISLALLGYGASGTFLTITRRWLTHHFTAAFIINAAGFGVFGLGSFTLAQQLPFNPLEMAWEWRQQLYLFVFYLLLAVPFFCAANCVGLAFRHYSSAVNRVYSADLLGAGLGALAVVAMLSLMAPENGLRLLVFISFIAAALIGFARSLRVPRTIAATLLIIGALIPALLPSAWTELHLSPYKGLSQIHAILGTQALSEHYSPLGRLDVVRNEQVPFRIAPGLSLNSSHEPPPQLGVLTDGDGISAITQYTGDRDALAYLSDVPSALPYYLVDRPNVLIIGAGGGTDILQALYFDAESIDAVELNAQMLELIREDYAAFTDGLFQHKSVTAHIAEARHFIASTDRRYDLLQLALIDSFAASSAGVHALNESYLYTIEAFEAYLDRLNPEGILAVTRWLKLPPRDSLKLFATARAALEKRGIQDPGAHLAMIRSWKTTTLLVKQTAFNEEDIRHLRDFCRERSFDLIFYPGITSREVNQYNLLAEPYFYRGVTALLDAEKRDDFVERYKFHIVPASDDKPYFFHFFKWGVLPELLSMQQHGGLPLLEWGYLILVATLGQALIASTILILVPLMTLRTTVAPRGLRLRTMGYFSLLGLAFLFVEIAFIQKFILFLGHPIYSVAVVICAFLIFAGIGSRYASTFAIRTTKRHRSPLLVANLFVTTAVVIYLLLLPTILQLLLGLPDIAKFIVALLLIAPLGFVMGMPFPLGLTHLTQTASDLVPWAWGINGCASVLSAILATLTAIHFGFQSVATIAAIFYLVAGVVFAKAKMT